MPKVTYNKTKGLIQETGAGFVMAAESLAGTTAADPGIALTISTGTAALSLADGSTAGQLKYFVSNTADDTVITPANTSGAYSTITMTNIGESVTCLWTGSGWAVLARGSGATANATTLGASAVLA